MNDNCDMQAEMVPSAWEVKCPCCEAWHEVESVEEDIAGAVSPAAESKFILCDCGCNIEIKGPKA